MTILACMALYFWYFAESNLSSVRCTVAYIGKATSHQQGTRNTRPCLSGRVVSPFLSKSVQDDISAMFSSLCWIQLTWGRRRYLYLVFPDVRGYLRLDLLVSTSKISKKLKTFFNGKTSPFSLHFIRNNTKLKPPQTLGYYAKIPSLYVIRLFQKFEKLSLKRGN